MNRLNIERSVSRRGLIKSAGSAALGLSLHKDVSGFPAEDLILYVSTYTGGKSEGIYIHRLNLASGELKPMSIAKGVANPSYLVIDAQHRYLCSVNEVETFGGERTGAVTAFAVDQRTG